MTEINATYGQGPFRPYNYNGTYQDSAYWRSMSEYHSLFFSGLTVESCLGIELRCFE